MKPRIWRRNDGWVVSFPGVKYGYGPYESLSHVKEYWGVMIEHAAFAIIRQIKRIVE